MIKKLLSLGLVGVLLAGAGCGPKPILEGDYKGKHYKFSETVGGGIITKRTDSNRNSVVYYDNRVSNKTLSNIEWLEMDGSEFVKRKITFGKVNTIEINPDDGKKQLYENNEGNDFLMTAATADASEALNYLAESRGKQIDVEKLNALKQIKGE